MENNNITPAQVEVINEVLTASKIESAIVHLENAEEALQKAAYDDDSWNYMFRFAYELKLIRQELERVEKVLGYEPHRD
ncbi:MAG: hypothetical protein PUK76_02555 [Treponema sp.]|nr:hypothetical protein [Treponema sp.]